MYERIVVPLDGSDLAECVLPHLEAIASGCHVAEVTLVYAIGPFDFPASSKEFEQKIKNEARTAARNYLKNVADRLKLGGVTPGIEVLVGKPDESIVEFASKKKADLIIMATHGRSGISRWVWGSVADRVLRSATTPVLLVRAFPEKST